MATVIAATRRNDSRRVMNGVEPRVEAIWVASAMWVEALRAFQPRGDRQSRRRLDGVSLTGSEQIHLRGGSQVLEFLTVALATRGLAHGAFGGEFALFEVAEDFLGALDDGLRHAGQAGDLDAVAFVRAAFDDSVQEHDLVVPLANGHVEVFEARQAPGEFGQFVIVGGKK